LDVIEDDLWLSELILLFLELEFVLIFIFYYFVDKDFNKGPDKENKQ